jgi:hypothetical protein
MLMLEKSVDSLPFCMCLAMYDVPRWLLPRSAYDAYSISWNQRTLKAMSLSSCLCNAHTSFQAAYLSLAMQCMVKPSHL